VGLHIGLPSLAAAFVRANTSHLDSSNSSLGWAGCQGAAWSGPKGRDCLQGTGLDKNTSACTHTYVSLGSRLLSIQETSVARLHCVVALPLQ